MRNLRIFLTCLLEELEAVVFVGIGIWLAWIIFFHKGLVWYFIAGIVVLMLLFNVATELIWHIRSKK